MDYEAFLGYVMNFLGDSTKRGSLVAATRLIAEFHKNLYQSYLDAGLSDQIALTLTIETTKAALSAFSNAAATFAASQQRPPDDN
jgi:hypothetical protein